MSVVEKMLMFVALLMSCSLMGSMAEMQTLPGKWRLNMTGNAITIVSESSKKCLDLPGGNANNGNLLQIWDCNGMKNQQWFFDSGTWRITYAGNSGKCIDAIGGGGIPAAGTKLGIWDCLGTDSQVWGYDSNMKTVFLAKSAANMPEASMCMDLAGGSNVDGTPIQVWNCNGLANQAWDINGAGPAPSPSPGPVTGVAHMTITLSGMIAGGSQDAILTYPNNAEVPNGGYPLITFAHGTDVGPASYQPLIDTVASYGFVVVAVGSCPFGECLNGWKDVWHAIDLCKSGAAYPKGHPGTKVQQLNSVNFNKVGLLGHSMGGGYVTAIASDPNAPGDNIVCGASLHGAPCSKYHTEGPAIPMLYTAGSNDRIVPSWVVHNVAITCKSKCDYELIQGVNHFPVTSGEATMAAKYLHGCIWGSRSTNASIIV